MSMLFSCFIWLFMGLIPGGNSQTVTCSGYQSCTNTSILTTSGNVHCYGARACVFSDIEAADRVNCDGYLGCAFATRIKG